MCQGAPLRTLLLLAASAWVAGCGGTKREPLACTERAVFGYSNSSSFTVLRRSAPLSFPQGANPESFGHVLDPLPSWSGLRPQPKMLTQKTRCYAFAVQG